MSTENEAIHVMEGYFETSKTVGKLYGAIAKAQLDLGIAVKDGMNPDKGKKYATLASVIEASKPYARQGVAILQIPSCNGSLVSVTTILAVEEEWIHSTLSIQAMRPITGGKGAMEAVFDAQGIGGAITYLRRYALSAKCLIGQDDDDAEKATKAMHKATAEAKAEAEAAAMFGEPEATKTTEPAAKVKAAPKSKRNEDQEALAQKRIVEEQAKLDATIAGPPASVQDRLEWFMSKDRTKYQHWDEFARIKADMVEALGDEGEPRYYEILGGFGVKKSNEFANRADSVAAYKMMLDVVMKAIGAPVPPSTVGAEDSWLPEEIAKGVAA